MSKQQKEVKVTYNQTKDQFELWLRNSREDEWGFSYAAKCVAANGSPETNFIHFRFVKELLRYVDLGYVIIEE